MPKNNIASLLNQINHKIEHACHTAKRPKESVSLIAVSKFHPLSAVQEALIAGHRLFGENRVQEAAEKFPSLRIDYPDLKLHIIGSLQTNKAEEACSIADRIETLDRPSLARALEKAAHKIGTLPELMIQINIGNEVQKSGVRLENAHAFIEENLKIFGDNIKGLMAIPPLNAAPRPYFKQLAKLAKEFNLPDLSMGMSSDFEEAILEGATSIRVGSAIFGARPTL